MKIYKYPLIIDGEQSIRMPKGAVILDLQMQGRFPTIWATIPEEKFGEMGLSEFRTFLTFGTGEFFPDELKLTYIKTYYDGPFVYHVFELVK